jgi:hypothetical protein
MNEHEPEFYEKLIYENEPKGYQLKLVVNEFRGVQYIHLRKYFLSYEGEFIPSREGVSMEASIHNILSLLEGLMEICSFEESDATILEFFSEKLYRDKHEPTT